MEIYILTLVLIFLFGLFEIQNKINDFSKRLMGFILYSLVVLSIGLRWETGTDWNNYLNNFENTIDFENVLINIISGYEIGYGSLVFIFKKISDNYSLFLFFHALFFYWGIFRMGHKYSPFFFITFLIYYSTNLGMVGSNRQLLSIAICLWGLDFVFKKKFVAFSSVIFFASLFHTTAILFSVYYFFDRNINKKVLFLLLLVAVVIGKTAIPSFLFNNFGGLLGELASTKAMIYSEAAEDNLKESNLSIFGLIKRLLLLSVFTYNYNFLSKELNYYKLLYNGYYFGIFIYFLFANSFIILVSRGSLYFNIMECCLISCQFAIFSKISNRSVIFTILLFLSLGLLFQSISTFPDLFNPYKGLFYNKDFFRKMY